MGNFRYRYLRTLYFHRRAALISQSQISTMKYKQHLTENIAPEYGPEPYLAYGELDDIIRQLSSKAPAR